MKIYVKLKGRLSNFRDLKHIKNSIILDVGDNIKISDVLKKIEIPRKHIGLIVVNKKVVNINMLLNEGDLLTLYPPIAGG
jgi:hypothetical protein